MSDARSSFRLHALVLVLVGALAFVVYRPLLGLGFLGWDTYPMILTSRIASFGDFLGTFTEELMDGRYTNGRFYRPVANFAFAFDYALYGLDARGYHVTDLVILIASSVLLFGLSRRLFGRGFVIAGFVAAVVFTVHPVHLELLPVPPRRADTLCLLFSLACLAVSAAPVRSRRNALLAGAFALLAFGSKETGAVLVPLVVGLHFLRSGEDGWARRARSAARRSVPVLAMFLAFAVARTALLGGLGGHPNRELGAVRELVMPYLLRVIFPQPLLTDGSHALALLAVITIGLLLLAVLIARRPGTSVVAERKEIRTGLLFLALWFVCLFAVTGLAGRVHDWYAMLFVAPYAVLLGVLVQCGVSAVRARKFSVAVPTIGLPLLLFVNHLVFSPLVTNYEGWSRADTIAKDLTGRFTAEVGRTDPGGRVVLERYTQWLMPSADGKGIRSGAILSNYGVQAFGELSFPSKKMFVEVYRGGPPPNHPGPDLIHVVLIPGM